MDSFLQAAENHSLSGVIGFNGWPIVPDKDFHHWPSPASLGSGYKVQILALFGGADELISSEQVTLFQEALAHAGIKHRIVVFPDADHGFLNHHPDEFSPEIAQAWAEGMVHIATYVAPLPKFCQNELGYSKPDPGKLIISRGLFGLQSCSGMVQLSPAYSLSQALALPGIDIRKVKS